MAETQNIDTKNTMRALAGEPLIQETFKELHHYTNLSGVKGILKSNQLWATHYTALNDQSEIQLLRDFLTTLMTPRIKAYILEKRNNDGFSFRRQVEAWGGAEKAAREFTAGIVAVVHDALFKRLQHPTPLSSPYIASFCGHTEEDAYEQQNGLLSQWRGYGGADGLAIVFNTHRLVELLQAEHDRHEYFHFGIFDVIYNTDRAQTDCRLEKLVGIVDRIIKQRIDGKSFEVDDVLEPLQLGAVRLKHRGFKEEHEVRIVACPLTLEQRERIEKTSETELAPRKAIKTLLRRGDRQHIPYIALFGETPLPIKRIIVGPGPKQATLQSQIRSQIPAHIKVVKSETPYVPQANS